ncbi:MAG: hypothetical protein ACYTGR_01860 [Planctomycetota bacterium]|jgi:hypothetical protein
MPTPVPLKILSRRQQVVRLAGALGFAFGVGVVVHAVRPHPTTQVRYEVIGALVLLGVTVAMLMLGLRRISFDRAATVLAIEGAALWIAFAAGVLTIGRRNLDEVVAVSVIFGALTVIPAIFVLALIQNTWPPRRSLSCESCDYDLSRSTGTVCTECGTGFESSCSRCGCELRELASGTCPDCQAALTAETVVLRMALSGRGSQPT